MNRKLPFGVIFALLVLGSSGVAYGDDEQFRREVFECEDALAKLQTCCPKLDASRVLCNYHETGGCTGNYEEDSPALSPDEAACIRAKSCGELHQQGTCEKAQSATPYVKKRVQNEDGGYTDSQKTHPPVCK